MDVKEIRTLPEKELLTKVGEIRQRLFTLHFKATTEDVSNPAEVRELRKDIARIHGVLVERKSTGKTRVTPLSRAARTVRSARKLVVSAAVAHKASMAKAAAIAKGKKAKSQPKKTKTKVAEKGK